MSPKLTFGVAALVVGVVVLTGCGEEKKTQEPVTFTMGSAASGREEPIDPPPPDPDTPFEDLTAAQIQEAVSNDMATVTSLRMNGSGGRGGQAIGLNVMMDVNGHCNGRLTGPTGAARMMSDGKSSYIKANRKFWVSTIGSAHDAQNVLDLVGDKWAKAPKGSADFSSFCDLTSLTQGMFPNGFGVGVTKGEIRTINGQRAIEISVQRDTQVDHMWVAIDGPHYVLRVETKGGADQSTYDLTEFNEPVGRVRPPKGQFVDVEKLTPESLN